LFGSCFGQEASTVKVGMSPAVATLGSANAMAAIRMEKACKIFASARLRPARSCHGAMATSLFWLAACGLLPLERGQSIAGRRSSQSGRRAEAHQRSRLVVVELAGLGPVRRAHRHDEFG